MFSFAARCRLGDFREGMQEQLDRRERRERLAALHRALDVFTHATVLVPEAELLLHFPALRDRHESFLTFDLRRNLPIDIVLRVRLAHQIALRRIRPHFLHGGVLVMDLSERGTISVSVLHVGRRDREHGEQAERINPDVPLFSLDLLARICRAT